MSACHDGQAHDFRAHSAKNEYKERGLGVKAMLGGTGGGLQGQSKHDRGERIVIYCTKCGTMKPENGKEYRPITSTGPEPTVRLESNLVYNHAQAKQIEKGSVCWYRDSDGSAKKVEVLSVDRSLIPPSYMISIDGRQHETEGIRLTLIPGAKIEKATPPPYNPYARNAHPGMPLPPPDNPYPPGMDEEQARKRFRAFCCGSAALALIIIAIAASDGGSSDSDSKSGGCTDTGIKCGTWARGDIWYCDRFSEGSACDGTGEDNRQGVCVKPASCLK